MNGFLLTPLTRFYAEALAYMKNTGQSGWASGSFAETVQDKLAGMGQQAAGGVSQAGERDEAAMQADPANKKKQKSFWEKRAERHKLYMDLAQKAWYKHENEREYQETIDLHRREVSSARLRQWSLERATGEKVELGVNPDVLSEAATELAQNYVFFKIPSALMNPKPKTSK